MIASIVFTHIIPEGYTNDRPHHGTNKMRSSYPHAQEDTASRTDSQPHEHMEQIVPGN